MIGRTLHHYRIVGALGKGGMGEVWLAEDTRLGRQVALKTLPASMAADPRRRARFEREARAVAALNHPNIVTIHSVEQFEGVSFLTMERVEGATLAESIPPDGLPLDRLLAIAIPLCAALEAAHERGVVHRDLKPANVIVGERGALKVLDFGLAKMAAAPAADDETRPTEFLTGDGAVLGTAPYMSPEQLAAGPLDHRTDLFSLGVVLYEMAAGRRPFRGRSSAELASAILRDAPPSLGSSRADLPVDLVRLIERCLAKDPDARPHSAREVREELAAVARDADRGVPKGPPVGGRDPAPEDVSPPTSIAVLPFSDMSPARDQDWFCEGIAEEILNALNRIPGLRVATRTSAFRYKDPSRDLRKIGEELGVTTLLEGGVRTAGSRLRVTAQLVSTGDGYPLWSDRFDGGNEDVFDIQDQIADAVVHALKAHLSSSADGPSRGRRGNVEAYHLFLKGRHFRYSKLDLRNAHRCFEQAVELDPSYAEARLALAEVMVVFAIYGIVPPGDGMTRAREEIARARALGLDAAVAHGVEGLLALVHDWDTQASLAAFRRAQDLDPSDVPSRAWSTWTLMALGARDEACELAREIVERDPRSPYANAMSALTYLMAGRDGEGLARARRALELDPDSLQATWVLGIALAADGEWDGANESIARAVDRSARLPLLLGLLAWCQAASGREDEARRSLAELARRSSQEYVTPLCMAFGHAELGDGERARELLDRAIAERSALLALPHFVALRRLRAEPAMQRLERRFLGEGGPVSG